MLSPVIFITLLFILQLKYPPIYSCDHKASCGCSEVSSLSSKIVGGQTVRKRTWSWVVSLRIRNRFRCAGSIISSSWILTAAHCFSTDIHLAGNVLQILPSDITVHAGSNYQYEQTQFQTVTDIIVHPKFDETTFNNDILLLKLSSPLQMNDRSLGKICLPSTSVDEYPPVNSSLVAVGWGRLWENGPESSSLQQVILNAIDYRSFTCYPLVFDPSKQFCAGVHNSKKDTCQGDSGGPLMMFTASQQWVIVGVTSFGYGCASPGHSGVYTRIAAHLDWISLSINDTTEFLYPDSSKSNTPFEDEDIDWQSNSSFHHLPPFFLILTLSSLITVSSISLE